MIRDVHRGVRRDVLGNPVICADTDVIADSDGAEDVRPGTDDDVVDNVGVALIPFLECVVGVLLFFEVESAEGDVLIEPAPVTDSVGLADDDAVARGVTSRRPVRIRPPPMDSRARSAGSNVSSEASVERARRTGRGRNQATASRSPASASMASVMISIPASACASVRTSGGKRRSTFPYCPAFQTRTPFS